VRDEDECERVEVEDRRLLRFAPRVGLEEGPPALLIAKQLDLFAVGFDAVGAGANEPEKRG
jgi:hypothetical protein